MQPCEHLHDSSCDPRVGCCPGLMMSKFEQPDEERCRNTRTMRGRFMDRIHSAHVELITLLESSMLYINSWTDMHLSKFEEIVPRWKAFWDNFKILS